MHLINLYRLFLFFIFFAAFVTKADAQLLTHKTISTEDGLLSNEIHSVLQDSKGYVWIGTKNGLCKWDGRNFEYFTIADGLPNNETISLYEDSTGRIWISCFSKELCYYFHGTIFNRINTPFLRKIKNYMGSNIIISNDEVYFSSMGAKVNKFNIRTQKLTTLYNGGARQFSYIKYKGKIWGIEDKRDRDLFLGNNVANLIASQDTSYYTRYYFSANSPDTDIITRIDFQNKKYGFQHGLDNPFYETSYANKDLETVVYNNGNILEAYKKFIIQKKNNYILSANSPNHPQIFANKKNLFVVTANGLLFCRQIPILEYEQDPQINNNAQFLFRYNNEVYAVNNEYNLINASKQKKVNQLNGDAINLYNLLFFDKRFYVTTSFYVYYFSNPNKAVNDTRNMGKSSFKYISPSKKAGYFFTANGTAGITLINFQKNISSNCLFLDPTKSVYSVYEDSRSRLWYSTSEKVYHTSDYYDGIKNSEEFVLDGSSPIFCKSIQEDNKGNLFFTTNGGVYVYDGKKKYHIGRDLLSDNECNKVVIDTLHNSFWVATKNGVNQIGYEGAKGNLKFHVISKFFATDGLRSDNINDLLLDSNKLYIATDRGVNILDDVTYRPDTTRIPVYIKLKAVNAAGSKAFDTLSHIALAHDHNNLTIGFSAIYFLRRDRLKVKAYLYRNGNLVSQNEITEDKIDYYSLNDGDYKLVLYAYDQDYRYNNGRSAPFLFTIRPPYYKTWWFIAGMSLLVIIISTTLLLWNLNRRKKRAIQQAQMQAKLNESTLKSLQSQMNPHFVFNSLNTIQSFITEKNEEGAIDYLSDFSGLMREILEQSVHTFISLENEIQFLRQYVQLEITRFKGSFDVTWNIDLEEDDLTDIYIPTMLIQPILENAVKHGVSNLNDAKGHIDVAFVLEDENMLKVTIRDNGRPSQNKKLKGNSIAVKTIKDRLNIYTKNKLKGAYRLELSQTGATATITIPI